MKCCWFNLKVAYLTHLLSVRSLVDRLEVPLRPLGVSVLREGRGGGGGGRGGRGAAGGARVVASEGSNSDFRVASLKESFHSLKSLDVHKHDVRLD